MYEKEDIHSYSELYSDSPSDFLNHLERETHLKATRPYMISGKLQGRFLSFISHLLKPKRILEIGTFTGYATLSLAEGLSKDGKIITLEANEELGFFANSFFKKSDYSNQIEIIIGDALDTLSKLDDSFDLVFIDAKKTDYSKYYDLVIDKVNSGGVIISDNVIWYGKTAKEVKEKDKKTLALQDFNQKLLDDVRVENFILPVRDGLNIARKK